MLCPGWECSCCHLEQLSEQLQQEVKGFCTILISRHLLTLKIQKNFFLGWKRFLWCGGECQDSVLPKVTLLGGLSNRLLGFLEQLLWITEKGWEQHSAHEALKVCLHCSIGSHLVCCPQHKIPSHRRTPHSAVIQRAGSRRSCWCLVNVPSSH